jgi:2-amino-4-hydroxy-6-hydroxymethyldihydropteridine diphosphokinase
MDLWRIKQSAWYQTIPVGPPQPDYINGCVVAELAAGDAPPSTLDPHQLMALLLDLEKQFGRIRTEPWGARTLDLDLILWGSRVLQTPELELPHPRFRERAFVLVPLAEILPDWRDPVSGLTIQQLCDRIDPQGVVRLNPA